MSSLFLKAFLSSLTSAKSASILISIWLKSAEINKKFSSAINVFLMSLPSSDLIGIFCKFGSLDAKRPVVVAASKNDV